MPVAMTMALKLREEAHRPASSSDLQLAVILALAHRCGIPARELEAWPRPYSLSPFQSGEPRTHNAHAQRACHPGNDPARVRVRLRVSWLDDAHLESMLLRAQGAPEEPGHPARQACPVRIEGLSFQPSPWDPWSRWDTYGSLFSSASDSLRTATLRFCSPTVLLREGIPYPLPDPYEIFRKYLELWNRFAGLPLDRGLAPALKQDLLLADFRLRSRPAGNGPMPTTCFSGSATFRLRGRQPETVLKGFNALADFAFYCGTGAKTQQGMGWTRRVFPGPLSNPEDGPERPNGPRIQDQDRAGGEVR